MKVNSSVIATVDKVEVYGLYLVKDSETILVLIPDVSLERISDLKALFKEGDTVKVKVLEYIEGKNLFKGSLID
ncbi:MAG: hypothetical protein NE328_13410 [Lentisphaeraceae bacterium]|nr:hypothetical protein [Lentisphaeraceae bacterium]